MGDQGDKSGASARGEPPAPANGRKPNGQKSATRRAFRLIALGLIPVGLLLALMYVRYVDRMRAYLVTRSYRALGTASRQVTARLEGLATRTKLSSPDPVPRQPDACPQRLTPLVGVRSIAVAVEPGGMLYVRGEDHRCQLLGLAEIVDQATGADHAADRAGLDFEQIVLVDERGSVLWRGTDDAALVTDLPELVGASTRNEATSGSLIARLPFVGGTPAKTVGWRDALTSPVSVTHLAQGYALFCQPIGVGRSRHAETWALCGLRRREPMLREAWAIPPSLLALAACLVATTILSWPTLKLRFLGAHDRLKASDVRLLVFSCLGGIGIVTFALALVLAHVGLTTELDEQSHTVARNFGDRLRTELCQAAGGLAQFKRVVAANPLQKDFPCSGLHQPRDVPAFVAFAAFDPNGTPLQRCQATGDDMSPAPYSLGNVKARGYFQDVGSDRLWTFQCAGQTVRAAVEVIRSHTTGQTTVAVAQGVPVDGTGQQSVAAMSTQPLSVFDTVLPAGLGFAVVRNDGRVLLHSDPARNLEENLIEECDDDPQLREAIERRHSGTVQARYYGHSHRLAVEPIAGTPWSVAVFRDGGEASRVTATTAFAWTVEYLGYIALWLLLLALLGTFSPGYRAEWLWPDAKRGPAYRRAAYLLGLVFVGCVAVTLADEGGIGDIPLLVGVPAVAIAVMYLLLGRTRGWARVAAIGALLAGLGLAGVGLYGRLGGAAWVWTGAFAALLLLGAAGRPVPDKHPDRPENVRRSFIGMLVVVLLIVAAWPAIVIFGDTWAMSLEAFTKRSQLDYVERLRQRRSPGEGGVFPTPLVDSREVDAGPGSQGFECGVERDGNALVRLVAEAMCRWSEDAHCRDAIPTLARHPSSAAFATFAPSNAAAASAVYMGDDNATDRGWCWIRGTFDGRNVLTLSIVDERFASRLPHGARFHGIVPALRRLDGPVSIIVWLAVIVGAAVVLGVLIRFVAGRLFLLDPPGTPPGSTPACINRSGKGPVWLYTRRWEFGKEPDGAPHEIDLLDVSTPEDLPNHLPAKSEKSSVIVDHIEARLGRSTWSEATVALLEELVFRRDNPVAILSEVDPLAFLSDGFAASEPTDEEGRSVVERFWRWVHVFAACKSVAQVKTATGTLHERIKAKAATSDRADDAFHWRKWAACTKAEKLVLSQLAHEGFLNPDSREVVAHLMARGLIRRDPAFKLDSDFARFVRAAEPTEDIERWEHEGEGPGWARVQLPLFAALLATAFFFLTQPQIYNASIGLMGALATAGGLMLRLVGVFGKQRGAGADQA